MGDFLGGFGQLLRAGLMEEDSPRVAYIEGEDAAVVNEDGDEGGAGELSVDLALEQVLVGVA